MPIQFAEAIKSFGETLVSSDCFKNEVMVIEFDRTRVSMEATFDLSFPSRFLSFFFLGVSASFVHLLLDY